MNRGISLFFHFYWDIGRGGDSSCFAKSGVGNLEKGAVQNFGNYPAAFGWYQRFFRTLLLSNHFERGNLFILNSLPTGFRQSRFLASGELPPDIAEEAPAG